MNRITDRADWQGVYAVVRSSCNVPLTETGEVRNTFRLAEALPTITYLMERGARVVMIAHIGRSPNDSLRPVYDSLRSSIPSLQWGGRVDDPACEAMRRHLRDGEVMLVENLRQHPGETGNDAAFAALLASLGDVYVNDAFDNIHREHASMLALPQLLPSYAGITLAREIDHLTKAMQPASPSLFILGGAKFETKIPLVEKYLAVYDQVFVGGALLNDLLVAEGYEVGRSLVSPVSLKGAAFLDNPKLIKTVDVVVDGPEGRRVVPITGIGCEDSIIDIGPETLEQLRPIVRTAKTILWNGPLGHYETAPEATETLARMVAESAAYSVIGGGDTVAAVEAISATDQFGFVSSGGGAMLTFLETGPTPPLRAIGL